MFWGYEGRGKGGGSILRKAYWKEGTLQNNEEELKKDKTKNIFANVLP